MYNNDILAVKPRFLSPVQRSGGRATASVTQRTQRVVPSWYLLFIASVLIVMSRKSLFTNMCSENCWLELGTCIMCPPSPCIVPTTTIIPSRSPAPNVVIICRGAGHCTHCTVYSVQCTVVSSLCRVTLDSCGADVRLFSHNTQCSVLAPPAQWHQCLHQGLYSS